jgi:hypothetical protein
MANDYTSIIQKIYVGYLGRPADPIGLAYYNNMLNAVNAPTTTAAFLAAAATTPAIAAIFDSFGNSLESKALYGSATTGSMINTIYNYVLGRNAETGGLTYWTQKIDTGEVAGSRLAFMVLQAAENDTNGDALTVASKIAVATAYTNSLDQPAEIAAFSGAAAASSARALLNGVYAGNTAAQFQAQVDANILALTGVTPTQPSVPVTSGPQTFTLTAGADSFTGASSNDTFIANSITLSAVDTLDGGAGIDTLNYTNSGPSGTTLANALISNIEIINVRNVSSGPGGNETANASNFTGATNFNSDRSTNSVSFTNLAAGQQVGVIGDNNVVSGGVSASYGNSVTTSTLNFSGGTKGTGSVTVNGTALTTETITSTGAANTTGTLNFAGGALTDVTINATTDFTTSGITGFKTGVTSNTIAVSGAASSVSLGTLANTVGVANGAGLTAGGIIATLGTNTDIKLTGGGGNDVITSNGIALATGASVNAGAGTDRLVLTGAITAPASAALYTSFEELKLNNITQDVSLFTGSTMGKLILDGGAVVQNASDAQAKNIQIVSSGNYNIGVTGASTLGQTDTVSLTVDDGLLATNLIILNPISLTGVENLNINAADNTSITSLVGASSLNNVNLSGSAIIGMVSGAVNFTSSTLVFDATAAINTVGIDLQNAQSTGSGVTIKGGSGNDVLFGSQQGDIIIAGAGNDILATGHAATSGALVISSISSTITTGIDTLTGGAGNDSFIISHSTVANASSITDLNLGGNGTGGVDSLWFHGTGNAVIVTLNGGFLSAVNNAGTLAAAVDLVLQGMPGSNTVTQFNYQGDTYIVANGTAGGTSYTAADDTLVKVTGVVGTLDASDIHFFTA